MPIFIRNVKTEFLQFASKYLSSKKSYENSAKLGINIIYEDINEKSENSAELFNKLGILILQSLIYGVKYIIIKSIFKITKKDFGDLSVIVATDPLKATTFETGSFDTDTVKGITRFV